MEDAILINQTNSTCIAEISNTVYSSTYLVIGIIIFAIGFSYLFYAWRDLCDQTPKLPGYMVSQILFIIFASCRGIGYIAYAGMNFSGNIADKAQPFAIGLPGYLMTISFYLLFFLWYRICVNLLFNDCSGKFDDIRCLIGISFTVVCLFGLIFMIVSLCANLSDDEDSNIKLRQNAHILEVVLAIIRDLGSALLFIIYTVKNIVFNMSRPRWTFAKNESIYCMMIFSLAGALLVRFISLIVFAAKYLNKDPECLLTGGNYANSLISSILSEVLPCIIAFISKKRSGLLSVYDYIA